MKCKNHADIDAGARCTGCQEAFCENCLVEMNGKKYFRQSGLAPNSVKHCGKNRELK